MTTTAIEFPNFPRMPGAALDDGYHPNMPAPRYFRVPAASNSLLKEVARSPMHALHYLNTQDSRETPSLRLGRLLHTRVLEPQVFARTVVPPPINEKTGEPYGKQTKAWAEYAQAHAGKDILTEDDAAAIDGMASAILTHPSARLLFECDGKNEAVLHWTDRETGLPCKGRVDRVCDGAVVDIKTCESARDEDFMRSVINYSYHVQAAMYCEGLKALGVGMRRYMIVAVESSAPYAVSVFDMTGGVPGHDWYGIGLELMRARLRTLADCLQTNTWPGYGDQARPLMVPAWYGARFTDGNDM